MIETYKRRKKIKYRTFRTKNKQFKNKRNKTRKNKQKIEYSGGTGVSSYLKDFENYYDDKKPLITKPKSRKKRQVTPREDVIEKKSSIESSASDPDSGDITDPTAQVRSLEADVERIAHEQAEANKNTVNRLKQDRIQKSMEIKKGKKEAIRNAAEQQAENERVAAEQVEMNQRATEPPQPAVIWSEPEPPVEGVYSYWIPFFGDNTKLYEFKTNMLSLIEQNKVCGIVKQHTPSYITSAKKRGEFYNEERYNLFLCIIMLVYGTISNKMDAHGNYNIIFKGGKAIQLILSNIQNAPLHDSDDIDILIMPKNGIVFDAVEAKQIAIHISNLIKWIIDDLAYKHEFSILLPDPLKTWQNQNIIKLGFLYNNGGAKALSDIDFKELPSHIAPYFMDPNIDKASVMLIKDRLNLSFNYPNIDSIINEKMYYFFYYIVLLNKNLNEYTQQENINIKFNREPYIKTANTCNFHLTKIIRALYTLFHTKVLDENPGIVLREDILTEIQNIINEKTQELLQPSIDFIVNDIYNNQVINRQYINNILIEATNTRLLAHFVI